MHIKDKKSSEEKATWSRNVPAFSGGKLSVMEFKFLFENLD